MKVPKSKEARRPCPGKTGGYLIIEALVYISLVIVVSGAAFMAMYRCIDHSMVVRRSAEDIVKAVYTGERWRSDIRTATGSIYLQETESGRAIIIPTASGDVSYLFSGTAVWRQAPAAPPVAVLANVKSSVMSVERWGQVGGWRWELELEPQRKGAAKPGRIRPLFTFMAVPGGNVQ